jgi:hypothetical protein
MNDVAGPAVHSRTYERVAFSSSFVEVVGVMMLYDVIISFKYDLYFIHSCGHREVFVVSESSSAHQNICGEAILLPHTGYSSSCSV